MIYILNTFVASLMAIISLSLAPSFSFWGVVPVISLMFLIGFAYLRKGFEPFWIAAISGIIFDFYSIYPFGLYLTLFLLVVSFVRFIFGEGLHEMSFLGYGALTAASLTVYFGAQLFLLWSHLETSSWFFLVIEYLKFITINMFFAFIFYYFNNWYFDHLLKLEDNLRRG